VFVPEVSHFELQTVLAGPDLRSPPTATWRCVFGGRQIGTLEVWLLGVWLRTGRKVVVRQKADLAD